MFKPEEMPLPPEINASAWKEWCADRKERGNPLTKRAAVLVMNKLRPFTYSEQADAVAMAIECGWSSVFPKRRSGFIETHTDTSWASDIQSEA